jgi:large-conductance mechanosensitive channel
MAFIISSTSLLVERPNPFFLCRYKQMLDTKDIIIITTAIYLGSVVTKFFTALSEGIVAPLLAPAAAAGKGVADFQISVAGVNLKIGEVLSALVNLVISFAVAVFAISILRTYFLSRIGASRTA